MAIAEMSKLNLVAVSSERDKILNALQRTRAAEIKTHTVLENTQVCSSSLSELEERIRVLEGALDYLVTGVSGYISDNKIKDIKIESEYSLTYSEFLEAGEKREQIEEYISRITSLEEQKKELEATLLKSRRLSKTASIYRVIKQPFSVLENTTRVVYRLGTMPAQAFEELGKEQEPLFYISKLNTEDNEALVFAAFHKSFAGDKILQGASFNACPFKEGTGESIYNGAVAEIERATDDLRDNADKLFEMREFIKPLRIYCDYLKFELEKASLSDKLRATQETFLLEAYVPKESEQEVGEAIDGVTNAAYYEFTKPAEDEIPPTLYRNNAVVSNFETITDMYSPPSSKEFDPNTIMAFFYSLFLGFIMADVGYGLIMLLGGGAIWLKMRAKGGGLARLSGVFAVSGIFAIVWGVLFDSVFGMSLGMPFKLPDAQNDMWAFVGIKVPAVLVISMELGVFQLFAGYICKAVQCFRRGEIVDGICEGVVWAVFSLGAGFAIAGFVDELNFIELAYAGGILAGASLVMAMLTAGRKEKFFGKFTKGFGAAYGIINYASDILSYARLYGLMLSGAVIAKIVSGYAVTGMNGSVGFVVSGNPLLIVLGVLILIVGHAFNFAIGLLGAYIHDARLQYVEFYGKFFEGDGELFAPLGSKHNYVRLKK
ncbi:MAG: hypothetical protein J1G07_00275 [Clostridiales bacterium]|nr:hypothetical protein [Clostridiales bacterium]